MPTAFEYLGPIRISRIMQAIQDVRLRQGVTRRFSSRLNRVPAPDDELMASFYGRVLIADLIADDARAGIYQSGRFRFAGHKAVNIKIGRSLSQSLLRDYLRLVGSMPPADAEVRDFFGPTVANALDGIDLRLEALACAMHLDRLDYDRLGFKAEEVTWGRPPDLNVTVARPWTDTDATPISDLLDVMEVAETRYGRTFNRLTCARQVFRHIVDTQEFQQKSRVYLPANLEFSNLLTGDYPTMQRLFEQITGLTIEFYDEMYHFQKPNGEIGAARFWPINKVLLDNSANDNNNAVADFAVGEVIESMFLGLPGATVLGAGGGLTGMPRRGPVAYMTYSADLNPPEVQLWAVDRAFPRKHDPTATALFSVGHIVESIEVTEPIF